jgi:hypothetical protein
MTDETKRKAIIFLILAALITVLLAAALPQFELQKGVPLPAGSNQTKTADDDVLEPPLLISLQTYLKSVIGLFLLIVTIYLAVKWRRQMNLRDTVQILLVIAAASLILTSLLYAFSQVEISIIPTAVEILPPEIPAVGMPLAPVPASLLWLVWVGLAGVILLLVIGMMRVRFQQKGGRDALVLEAEQALGALKAGQDFSNVIIHCYEQMSLVLKKEQGLTLENTMTAREFEALLEKRGVPNPPVRQLTQLFEIARYAEQAPGPAEEVRAIECLNSIARYSQNRVHGQAK